MLGRMDGSIDWLRDRVDFFRGLAKQKTYSLWGAVFAFAYGWFSFWRDNWATHEQQEKFRGVNFLPHWPVSWWIAIVLGFTVVWVFEAAYRLQKPGMDIVLFPYRGGVEITNPDGDVRALIEVGLRNGSASELLNCQLVIRWEVKGSPSAFHFITAPFSLRRDEMQYHLLLGFKLDTTKPFGEIPLYDEVNGKWRKRSGGMLLEANRSHHFTIEALATGSAIRRKKLTLSHEIGYWVINGRQPDRER
jgi:hypothetical protein